MYIYIHVHAFICKSWFHFPLSILGGSPHLVVSNPRFLSKKKGWKGGGLTIMVSNHLLTEMLHQVILGVQKKRKKPPAPHVSRLVTSWAVNLDIELKRHPPGRCLGFIPFRAP